MRPFTSLLLLLCFMLQAHGQLVIDKPLLTEMVQASQEEIKVRWLQNLVRGSIKTTNYTTYNTLYDCVDILTHEKTSEVMTKLLVRKAADYGLTYLAAFHVERTIDPAASALAFSMDGVGSLLVQRAEAYDLVKVNKKTEKALEKLIERGYLMDTLYKLLAALPFLTERNLFGQYGERSWDWSTAELDVNYATYWKDPARAPRKKTLDDAVTAFIGSLSDVPALLTGLKQAWNDVNTTEQKSLTGAPDLTLPDLRELDVTDEDAIKAAITLFRSAARYFGDKVAQNGVIDQMAELITKYIIFDPEFDPGSKYGFRVDVEGIILAFEDRFLGWNNSPTKNAWVNVRPFFTIGLNYGYFGGPDTAFSAETTLGQRQIAWAGEKIGLKWRIWDWGYTRSREAGESFKYHGNFYVRNVRPRTTLISNIHLTAYASGVLYTIADLRSDNTFNSVIGAVGLGIQFFNKMEMNASYALPVDADAADAGFVNVGFDIPIFEYIRAARAKRSR